MHIVLGALIGWFFGFKGLAVMLLAIVAFVVFDYSEHERANERFMKSLAEDMKRPPRKGGGIRL